VILFTTHQPYYIDHEKDQADHRSVLDQPNAFLHLDQHLEVIFITVHVQAEKENKQMECPKYQVKDKPVLFHGSPMLVPKGKRKFKKSKLFIRPANRLSIKISSSLDFV
jgi:hypothetical protein